MKSFIRMSILIVAIIAVQLLYGWFELFELLKSFAENNANPFVFLTIMSLGCAIGLPISFCTLFSGAAFGIVLGSALSIFGIAISSLLGYVVGKYFLPLEQIQTLKKKFSIDNKKTMFDLNFYIRAVPGIPYSMQNVILGAMNSELKLYILMSISIQGTIAVVMNILGASFTDDSIAKYIAFAILVLVIVIIRLVFKKFYKM